MDDAYATNWNGTFEWLAFRLDGYDPDSLSGASLEEKNIERTNEYEVGVIVNTMDFSFPRSVKKSKERYPPSSRRLPLCGPHCPLTPAGISILARLRDSIGTRSR